MAVKMTENKRVIAFLRPYPAPLGCLRVVLFNVALQMTRGVSMAKSPWRGIFCEGRPVTKEHFIGEWLREIFPRDTSTTHTLGKWG